MKKKEQFISLYYLLWKWCKMQLCLIHIWQVQLLSKSKNIQWCHFKYLVCPFTYREFFIVHPWIQMIFNQKPALDLNFWLAQNPQILLFSMWDDVFYQTKGHFTLLSWGQRLVISPDFHKHFIYRKLSASQNTLTLEPLLNISPKYITTILDLNQLDICIEVEWIFLSN